MQNATLQIFVWMYIGLEWRKETLKIKFFPNDFKPFLVFLLLITSATPFQKNTGLVDILCSINKTIKIKMMII